MDSRKCRRLGALWMIGQGLVTALAPQLSVWMIKKTIAKNFENAEKLSVKPAYLRQLRAFGIGMAAAGIAGLTMERVASHPEEASESDDPEAVDEPDANA